MFMESRRSCFHYSILNCALQAIADCFSLSAQEVLFCTSPAFYSARKRGYCAWKRSVSGVFEEKKKSTEGKGRAFLVLVVFPERSERIIACTLFVPLPACSGFLQTVCYNEYLHLMSIVPFFSSSSNSCRCSVLPSYLPLGPCRGMTTLPLLS